MNKKLFFTLGFQPKENTADTYAKSYQNNYSIEIDVKNNIINYGGKIKVYDKFTQNITKQEDWVVLECVNRLLEKGYKPQDIALEKIFPSGHGHSGRLDIFVKKEGKAFLMIECKTYGKEYDKELANIYKNGGQLLTYFQNDTNAEYLMLYASAVADKEIKVQQSIIKIEEHYRDAGNVVDVFERWNKITLENGIFEDWVTPYFFENKRIIKKELTPLDEKSSTGLFHDFLSILRKHSVSDKPNAFNVIFDLFLAKLWDEKKEDEEEVDFQWRENEDDPVKFQYRLLDLYRAGMDDFLKKEVFALQDSDLNAKSEEELKAIKKKVLMLEKAFNIKSVIDEESFEENHRVLKEIVELLQRYKIRYPRKQQHLSDFFERLLTTGLKQEVGQFFTPPPITRFIVKSLPIKEQLIESIDQKTPQLPAMIDYAVGSGHFLTEIMEEYQTIINTLDIDDFKTDAKKKIQKWRIDEYDWAAQYVYGVDKDYRLVKTAKVGCYFYGDGLAQVIHGDGLDNFQNSKAYRGLLKENANKPQFQFVLSNPPYSVSAFKTTLRAIDAQKDFTLFDSLTDKSSEIECLFVERTKQLLKEGGMAGVILPSSMLSNSGIYAKAREIILQYFDIVAIAEFGSNTFMATGTNTVTLFLRRRDDEDSSRLETSLDRFFADMQDVTLNGIERPIGKYVAHLWEGVSMDDYLSLLKQEPNVNIQNYELYKEYKKKIKAKDDKEFWTKLLAIEKEKIFYFILAYPQKVVLVKSGSKDAEKRFLGYEFSNRRGSEGIHPIQRGKSIEECTGLFDPNVFDNPTKASTYIYKAFEGDFDTPIDEAMINNVSRHNLVDMLTFDRVEFEKSISLSVKKKVKIESKWELKRFDETAQIIRGVTYSKGDQTSDRTGKIILTADNITLDGNLEIKKEVFLYNDFEISTEKKLAKNDIFICFSSGSKEHLGKVAFIENDTNYFAGGFMGIIRVGKQNEPKYFFQLLNTLLRQTIRDIGSGSNINNLSGIINEVKIPLPPLDIQQKIVDEIEILEVKEEKAKEEVESLKSKSNKIFTSNKETFIKRFDEVCELKAGNFVKVGDISKKKIENTFPCYGGNGLRGYVKTFTHEGKYSLVGRQGALCGNIHLVEGKFHATEHALVAKPLNDIDTNWLHHKLVSMNLNQYATGTAQPGLSVINLKPIEINVPPLSEQQKIVSEIEKIEEKITILEKEIAEIPKQKEAILKKYL